MGYRRIILIRHLICFDDGWMNSRSLGVEGGLEGGEHLCESSALPWASRAVEVNTGQGGVRVSGGPGGLGACLPIVSM